MDRERFLKKHGLKVYDLVELSDGGQKYAGYIYPPASGTPKDVLVLKLGSGYNAGLKIGKGMEARKMGVLKAKKPQKAGNSHDPKLPTIAIVQVGGTIAARVDYEKSGVSASISPEELLAMFPNIEGIANYRCTALMNVLSENMRLAHYPVIARAVAAEIKKGAKGVIIPHGTDTMCYTAAALSFMLENVPVPVILVGSQRSSDRGSTDAALNLFCASRFITGSDFRGVAICMHEGTGDKSCLILPGTKTRKMHTSRRDAFRAVNARPIARVSREGRIEFIGREGQQKPGAEFRLRDKIEERVAMVRVSPTLDHRQIELCRKMGMKGVVLEGTGFGNAPIKTCDRFTKENAKVFAAIKSLCRGAVVVMASQCISGRVRMHVYSTGIELRNAGVIGAEDMLPETALLKLAWLLGNYKKQEARGLIEENLRGEITPGTAIDVFPQDLCEAKN